MTLIAFLAMICLALLNGCGGGGSSPVNANSAGTGRATFTVLWPTPSRLIPVAANSIVVQILNGSTVLGSQTLTRPAGAAPASVKRRTSFGNMAS